MLRCFVLVSLLCGLTHGLALADSLDPKRIQQIDADVRAILDRTKTPSAIVAIIRNDHMIYRKAYGLRDRERRLAADIDTLYELGSITKQFTAAAILQLQQDGKLNIDDKLSKYLPNAPHADELTLRQLLSHTSGLPEYFDGPDIESAATQPATFAQLMARIADKPLAFAPGSAMTYSNTGYILLGRLIEVVSHQPYREYVREHLLKRAGMKRTYTVANEAQTTNTAVGYQVKKGVLQLGSTIDESFGWSAGNLVSTVGDLAKWDRAFVQGRIVNKRSYREMTTITPISQGTSDYGLGLFVDSVRDQPRIGHTGSTFGFTTADEFFPKQNVRVIALTNCDANPEPGEMVTSAIFDDLFPEIAAAARKPAPDEDVAVGTQAKKFFAGLQRGEEEYTDLAANLAAKMRNGMAKHFAEQFAPFGSPKQFIYKGSRLEKSTRWYDYVIEFGPGSQLKFAIGIDDGARIVSISFG